MDKKLFVVLEQGNKCNTELAYEHKEQFCGEYCDWFRLNWKNDVNDKMASFFDKDIVWTEGRSILYERVKGKYQYYIFIDDDVKFISQTERSVQEELKYFLESYNPIGGTLYGDNWAWNLYKKDIENSDKEVFPIMSHDLCCHIFHESFAEKVFPVYFHGSGKSMWYAQFLAYTLYPHKYVTFRNVIIKNTEHLIHHDHTKVNFTSGDILVQKFSQLIKSEELKAEFLKWNSDVFRLLKNKYVFNNIVSKEKIEFSYDALYTIINEPNSGP